MANLNETVLAELEHYPRGPRGSAQNLFRAFYQSGRLMRLAADPTASADECEQEAVASVHKLSDPSFVLNRV